MMNSTAHDDDNYDDDCDKDAGGCDNDGCTGNHDIRYLMFETITDAATDDDGNGDGGCNNGDWH